MGGVLFADEGDHDQKSIVTTLGRAALASRGFA